MSLLSKWLVSMVALYIAAWVVPGIRVQGNGWVIFSIVAIILSVLNATIRPILKFLSCGLILITLGLFIFIIDASVLMLASNIAINWFGIGFTICKQRRSSSGIASFARYFFQRIYQIRIELYSGESLCKQKTLGRPYCQCRENERGFNY